MRTSAKFEFGLCSLLKLRETENFSGSTPASVVQLVRTSIVYHASVVMSSSPD